MGSGGRLRRLLKVGEFVSYTLLICICIGVLVLIFRLVFCSGVLMRDCKVDTETADVRQINTD